MHTAVPWRRASALALLALPLFAFANGGGTTAGRPGGGGTTDRPASTLEARLSPDQHWLAVCAAQISGEMRCWAVALDGQPPRELSGVIASGADTLGWDAESHLRLQTLNGELGVREMRWLDLATQNVVRSTRDRDAILAELRASSHSWAIVEERRISDRRLVRTVTWRDAGRRVEITTTADSQIQIVDAPGIVFYSTRTAEGTQVFRCEVESGSRREVVRSDAPVFTWCASPDGRELLLAEQGNDSRSRVVDAVQGTLLHGPWMTSTVHWLDGVPGRYIAATVAERCVVIDTLRDRQLETGFDTWPWMMSLTDGRFVVEDDRVIMLWGEDLQLERTLFIAP